MSKGMERKKEDKKKPAKTLEEKRAAKKAKSESRLIDARRRGRASGPDGAL